MPTATTMPPQQQVPIPVPPRIISTKDCAYLKDALSWELLAFKKFHFYAQQVQDPQIRQAMDKAGRMHQRHYQQLLKHLEVNNQTALASLQPQLQQAQSSS